MSSNVATTGRPQVEMALSSRALRGALGPGGLPASLAFAARTVTVVTPLATTRVDARPQLAPVGALTAGLSPRDADVLRHAAAGPDTTVRLAVTAFTVSLIREDHVVTIGRR